MSTILERAMAKLERDRATNMELRKSMILAPSPRQWWEKETIEFAFAHPHVRNRLERLMGSNIVRITDRHYMQRLQERILEHHLEQQKKRMKDRENKEIDREKRLILAGKLPMATAHIDLQTHHPVLKITRLAATTTLETRAKPGRTMPKAASIFDMLFEVSDDMEKAAVTGLTPSKFKERISMISRGSSTTEDKDEGIAARMAMAGLDDIEKGYMFKEEAYQKLNYEAEAVRQLRTADTVDEMYRLADEAIGMLRTMKSIVYMPQSKPKPVEEQPAEQPTDQPEEQPAEQPAEQQPEQPAEQPTNEE